MNICVLHKKTCNCPAKCEVPFWNLHQWNMSMMHCPSSLFSSSNTTSQIRISGQLVCGKKALKSSSILASHQPTTLPRKLSDKSPTTVSLFYTSTTTPCYSLFFCYCSTSTTTVVTVLPLVVHHATASFSVTVLPLLLHHATASPLLLYHPHSTRNYPATTLPVFLLFHILHHCF